MNRVVVCCQTLFCGRDKAEMGGQSNLKCFASHGTFPECRCYVFNIWPSAENQHLFAFVKTFCKHSTQTHMKKTERIMGKKKNTLVFLKNLQKHIRTYIHTYFPYFLSFNCSSAFQISLWLTLKSLWEYRVRAKEEILPREFVILLLFCGTA